MLMSLRFLESDYVELMAAISCRHDAAGSATPIETT